MSGADSRRRLKEASSIAWERCRWWSGTSISSSVSHSGLAAPLAKEEIASERSGGGGRGNPKIIAAMLLHSETELT